MPHEDKPKSMDEAELGNVSGGFYGTASGPKVLGYFKDNRGNTCGENVDGVIKYWPCPKCGKSLHIGSGVYQCDPCNDWFFWPDSANWPGSAAELTAAASN